MNLPFIIRYDDNRPKFLLIPKGLTKLKELGNGILEDSYGRRYVYDENGALRRLKSEKEKR